MLTGARETKETALGRLRLQNKQLVLSRLRDGGPATQAQLSELTGLSKATISNLVNQLALEGAITRSKTIYNGRSALMVELTQSPQVAFGIDITPDHCAIVLVGVSREVLAYKKMVRHPKWGLESFCVDLRSEMDAIITAAGRQAADVIAVGAGLGAPIERETGAIALAPMAPKWFDTNALTKLEHILGFDIIASNDANLCALAEVTWGRFKGVKNLIYVLVSGGVGAGLIVDGNPCSGSAGHAGEIGHMRIWSSDQVCRCGNEGCLETEISVSAIMGQARAEGQDVKDESDLLFKAESGNGVLRRIIDRAGITLGSALGNLSAILNPQVVVLGGSKVAESEIFISGAEAAMRRWGLPINSKQITVGRSSLGEFAGALGAAEIVLRSEEAAKELGHTREISA